MKSIWQETELPQFPQLYGDIRTDVLIIGGGLAGILTAYFLRQNGVDCTLVERGRLCGGNTGRTTAKITAQHGLIYDRLLQSGGRELAQGYLEINTAAIREYARISRDVACGFETRDNYVFSGNREKLELEMQTLMEIGAEAVLYSGVPLPVPAGGAVKFPNQAQFHPLKFAAGIAKDLTVYENTFVREMLGNTAVTDRGRITAERVVCATHFPFVNKHGSYFLKLYQHRSYVLALENAPLPDGMYADEKASGLSFRSSGDLLLLGGGGARTGKKHGGWDALRAFAREHYPDAREKYAWAAQDCMTLDGVPYIGQYSKRTPKLFVETGFNKWGMTGAMVSAMLITDRILGRENPYAWIFNPSRSILKPQLILNGAESAMNLFTPTQKRCPHLGCALKWNPEEHSWDCPCHGSRFAGDGSLLDNPANGDLRN